MVHHPFQWMLEAHLVATAQWLQPPNGPTAHWVGGCNPTGLEYLPSRFKHVNINHPVGLVFETVIGCQMLRLCEWPDSFRLGSKSPRLSPCWALIETPVENCPWVSVKPLIQSGACRVKNKQLFSWTITDICRNCSSERTLMMPFTYKH